MLDDARLPPGRRGNAARKGGSLASTRTLTMNPSAEQAASHWRSWTLGAAGQLNGFG